MRLDAPHLGEIEQQNRRRRKERRRKEGRRREKEREGEGTTLEVGIRMASGKETARRERVRVVSGK